jgi:hypothetical protein
VRGFLYSASQVETADSNELRSIRGVHLRGVKTRPKSGLCAICLNKTRPSAEEIDVWYVISEDLNRMLVLKRAVSLILTFVLAYSPTLAFARGSHANHFQAQSTAAYNRQVEVQKAKALAQKKAAKLASAKNQKIYSSVGQAIGSIFRPVRIEGKDYVVSQVAGKGKKAKVQLLTGNGFQEILVDEFNTGTASIWQVNRGNLEVKASHPLRGSFTQIDVRERRAKSYVHTHLQMNPDFHSYRVANYSIEPFQTAAYSTDMDEIKLEDACSPDLTGSEGVTGLKELLGKISSATMTPEAAFTCNLKHYEKALFGKSCFEGDFKDSVPDMVAGLAKIFASSTNEDTGSKPRFLQCLNQKGFGINSAQMQADFVRDNSIAKALVGSNTGRPEPDSTNSCSELDQMDIYKDSVSTGTKSVLAFNPLPGLSKPFSCDATIVDPAKFKGPDQVLIKFGSAKMATRIGGSPADAYAQILFHELLHRSGFSEANELLVQDLEKCCGSSDPNSKASTASCNTIDAFVAARLKTLNDQSLLGVYVPGYSNLYADLVAKYGVNKADAMTEQWFAALKGDPNGSAAWNELQSCIDKDPKNQESIAACRDAARAPILAATKSITRGKISLFGFSGLLDKDMRVADSASATAQYNPNDAGYGTEANIPVETISVSSIQKAIIPRVEGLTTFQPVRLITTASPKLKVVKPSKAAGKAAADAVTAGLNQSQVTAGKEANANVGVPSAGNEATAVAADSRNYGNSPSADGMGSSPDDGSGDQLGAPASSTVGETAPTYPGQSSSDTLTTPASQPFNPQTDAPANSAAFNSGSAYAGQAFSNVKPDSPKPMPVSIAGARPGSQAGPSLSASTRTATQLLNFGSGIMPGALAAIAQATPANAAMIAPSQARLPATVSEPTNIISRNSGMALAPARQSKDSSGGASGGPVAEKAKAKASDGGSVSDKDAPSDEKSKAVSASSRDLVDSQSAAAVANFETLKSKPADVLWKGLVNLGPETLARELGRGDSSGVVRTLRASGWSVLMKNNKTILMNPAKKCFAPDPVRTLRPLSSCG